MLNPRSTEPSHVVPRPQTEEVPAHDLGWRVGKRNGLLTCHHRASECMESTSVVEEAGSHGGSISRCFTCSGRSCPRRNDIMCTLSGTFLAACRAIPVEGRREKGQRIKRHILCFFAIGIIIRNGFLGCFHTEPGGKHSCGFPAG